MKPPPSFRTANVILGGTLPDLMREWRTDPNGLPRSFEWIGREVARLTEGAVIVSHVTISSWWRNLDDYEIEAAA